MVARVGCAAAIFEDQAFEAAVVGFAQGGVNANVGRDAGEDQVLDAQAMQQQFEIGGIEGTFAGLVDNRFAGQRSQFRE